MTKCAIVIRPFIVNKKTKEVIRQRSALNTVYIWSSTIYSEYVFSNSKDFKTKEMGNDDLNCCVWFHYKSVVLLSLVHFLQICNNLNSFKNWVFKGEKRNIKDHRRVALTWKQRINWIQNAFWYPGNKALIEWRSSNFVWSFYGHKC